MYQIHCIFYPNKRTLAFVVFTRFSYQPKLNTNCVTWYSKDFIFTIILYFKGNCPQLLSTCRFLRELCLQSLALAYLSYICITLDHWIFCQIDFDSVLSQFWLNFKSVLSQFRLSFKSVLTQLCLSLTQFWLRFDSLFNSGFNLTQNWLVFDSG